MLDFTLITSTGIVQLAFLKYGNPVHSQETQLQQENVTIVDIKGKTAHQNNMEQQGIQMHQTQSTSHLRYKLYHLINQSILLPNEH